MNSLSKENETGCFLRSRLRKRRKAGDQPLTPTATIGPKIDQNDQMKQMIKTNKSNLLDYWRWAWQFLTVLIIRIKMCSIISRCS
jgi:hypothetical protein